MREYIGARQERELRAGSILFDNEVRFYGEP